MASAAPPQFSDFVFERQRSLLKFATVLTGDPYLAEEICADVLGRVYEKWSDLHALDQLNAYVRRMIVNDFVTRQRRRARALAFARRQPDPPNMPDPALALAERDEMVQRLAGLPNQQRSAVVLRYYEGLSDEQIAQTLGCRTATVRSHISRALSTLRIDLAGASAGAPTGSEKSSSRSEK